MGGPMEEAIPNLKTIIFRIHVGFRGAYFKVL